MTKTFDEYCIISDSPGELRALSFKNKRPIDFLVRRSSKKALMRHDVHMAKVEQWSPGLGGVFMCLGDAGKAFMPAPKGISLKPGGLYPVMIVRSPVGDKLARVSIDIVFASARMILIPQKAGVHLSHRAKHRAGQAGQLILHSLKQAGLDGILIRESALGVATDTLIHEAKFLTERAKAFKEEVKRAKAPCLMRYATHYLDWFVADILATGQLQIGCDTLFNTLRTRWHHLCPDLIHNIVPIDSNKADALIDEQMDILLRRRVPFGNVGELVFDHTEALTAIDINAFAGHKKGHRYQFNLNMQAVPELVRHIRLRNIGGPIVIDFINMPDDQSRQAVETEMKKSFANDPYDTKILPISELGMMQMTREKSGLSISEVYLEEQKDMLLSFDTVALNLVRMVARRAKEYHDRRFVIVCHPDFIDWMKHKPHYSDMISPDLQEKIHWKSDSKIESRSPYMTVAGISEPFFI